MVGETEISNQSPGLEKVVLFSELSTADIAPYLEISGFAHEGDLDRFVHWLKDKLRPGFPEGIQESRKWGGVVPLSAALERQKYAHHFIGATGNIGVTILPPPESFIDPESGEVDVNHIASFIVQRDFKSTGRGVIGTEYTLCNLYINPRFSRENKAPYLKMDVRQTNKKKVGNRLQQLNEESKNQSYRRHQQAVTRLYRGGTPGLGKNR